MVNDQYMENARHSGSASVRWRTDDGSKSADIDIKPTHGIPSVNCAELAESWWMSRP
jgi:hypothetical protein